MTRSIWLGVLSCLLLLLATGPASQAIEHELFHHPLAGSLVDYTNNHGNDRRIWSAVLCQKRDLYVYLPPGFDPHKCYPVLLWMHGIIRDEKSSAKRFLPQFDSAMACGKMPPTIIAFIDGSYLGRPALKPPKTLFLNSNLGDFEDYVVQDVWGFLNAHYPIRPDRRAHVIGGYSGGGAAAYRIAIKHRDKFGTVFAISSPLNVRWIDCSGKYFSDFHPECMGWRTDIRTHEVVGRFYGILTFRLGKLIYPLYGKGPEAIEAMSRENPIEMLDAYDVRPGQLAMFVGYGGKDEFNIAAQVESFLYRAMQKCLKVDVAYDPKGRHTSALVEQFLPQVIDWLAVQLAQCPPIPIVPPAK